MSGDHLQPPSEFIHQLQDFLVNCKRIPALIGLVPEFLVIVLIPIRVCLTHEFEPLQCGVAHSPDIARPDSLRAIVTLTTYRPSMNSEDHARRITPSPALRQNHFLPPRPDALSVSPDHRMLLTPSSITAEIRFNRG
jgi:hypothetical protein